MPDPRWFELVTLYLFAPLGFAFWVRRSGYRGAMFPLLWLLSAAAAVVLLRDPSFDRSLLVRLPLASPYLRVAGLRFLAFGAVLTVASRVLSPEWFLWLPRRRPRLWWMLVFGYPLVSALPQGVIWRVFFVHRYAPLLPGPALLVGGGVAFAVAHLTFRNVVAIALTAIGGMIFLDTYLATRSMLLATLEHGAYGVLVFTLGLGRFLYLAALPTTESRPDVAARRAGRAAKLDSE